MVNSQYVPVILRRRWWVTATQVKWFFSKSSRDKTQRSYLKGVFFSDQKGEDFQQTTGKLKAVQQRRSCFMPHSLKYTHRESRLQFEKLVINCNCLKLMAQKKIFIFVSYSSIYNLWTIKFSFLTLSSCLLCAEYAMWSPQPVQQLVTMGSECGLEKRHCWPKSTKILYLWNCCCWVSLALLINRKSLINKF